MQILTRCMMGDVPLALPCCGRLRHNATHCGETDAICRTAPRTPRRCERSFSAAVTSSIRYCICATR